MLVCDTLTVSIEGSFDVRIPPILAETGTAALECATATSRRSFIGIGNGGLRPKADYAKSALPRPPQSGLPHRTYAQSKSLIYGCDNVVLWWGPPVVSSSTRPACLDRDPPIVHAPLRSPWDVDRLDRLASYWGPSLPHPPPVSAPAMTARCSRHLTEQPDRNSSRTSSNWPSRSSWCPASPPGIHGISCKIHHTV